MENACSKSRVITIPSNLLCAFCNIMLWPGSSDFVPEPQLQLCVFSSVFLVRLAYSFYHSIRKGTLKLIYRGLSRQSEKSMYL